jgi:Ni2+-binding GTPase involved in maturation of urease and hydrogenase
VTVLSAPPGSGKTMLLRSWIGEAGLGERAAWVLVGAMSVMRRDSGCRCWEHCAGQSRGQRWCAH